MATAEIYTGTVTQAGWVEGPYTDYYQMTVDVDGADVITLEGTQRLNFFPEAGQRIRFAAKETKTRHVVRALRDEIDPETQMKVQIELI